jgi:putative endonuclease
MRVLLVQCYGDSGNVLIQNSQFYGNEAVVAKWYTWLPAGRRAFRMDMTYYVYILKSLKTGEYYKGITNSIIKRCFEHNSGKVRSTKSKIPWSLIHVQISSTRNEARNLEKFFKSGFGREIIREIDH